MGADQSRGCGRRIGLAERAAGRSRQHFLIFGPPAGEVGATARIIRCQPALNDCCHETDCQSRSALTGRRLMLVAAVYLQNLDAESL
jgi:hypothetical protein